MGYIYGSVDELCPNFKDLQNGNQLNYFFFSLSLFLSLSLSLINVYIKCLKFLKYIIRVEVKQYQRTNGPVNAHMKSEQITSTQPSYK